MGDAGGEAADGLELLRLAEFHLGHIATGRGNLCLRLRRPEPGRRRTAIWSFCAPRYRRRSNRAWRGQGVWQPSCGR
jgi:hypothetical protein